VVTNFEPRVENVEVDVEPQDDNNTFSVIIRFDIVGQAFPPQEFSFLIEATR
jgi:predicted component of type VI protein secretion system